MGNKRKSIWAGIVFLLVQAAVAFSDTNLAKEDLPAVQLKLEKDKVVLLHNNQSYFYPINEFNGIKQMDHSHDLNGNRNEEYILGVQLRQEDLPVGGVFVCEVDGGNLKILKQIPTGDYFQKFELLYFGEKKNFQEWLIAWGQSGVHHTNLQIAAFRDGKFVTLFDKGSAAGVDFKQSDDGIPQVWVGRANWDDPNWNYAGGERLWEVHVWNGKEFVYDQTLSTSPLQSEMEEVTGYVQTGLQYIEKKKSGRQV